MRLLDVRVVEYVERSRVGIVVTLMLTGSTGRSAAWFSSGAGSRTTLLYCNNTERLRQAVCNLR